MEITYTSALDSEVYLSFTKIIKFKLNLYKGFLTIIFLNNRLFNNLTKILEVTTKVKVDVLKRMEMFYNYK